MQKIGGKANLISAHLERADLSSANLERANLISAHLEEADLREAHLEGSDLSSAHLKGAIVYYNNTRSEEIKAQGGIVLYLKENPDCRLHKLKAKRNKKAFECELYDSIDLIKTQQANPDWEISIEEIE